jgi:hypothetical protein
MKFASKQSSEAKCFVISASSVEKARRFQKHVFAIATVGLLFLTEALHPCDIPVFRYALEEWEADPYGVIVFHRGPLSPEGQAVLDALRKRALDGQNPANLAIQMVDLAGQLPKGAQAFWEKYGGTELPWAVVRYPLTAASQEVVWRGRLTQAAADSLMDSPKRQEIARRILEGDSVVWVLLESGDKAKDEAAFGSLTAQLERLQKTLRLPPSEDELLGPSRGAAMPGFDSPASPLPLRLSFSVVRLERSDPAEQTFVNMLLKSEADLTEYEEEPMAFPVFGRGRVLCALVGKGINQDTIADACMFLTDACSCQVKAANPGTDILMAVNWVGALSHRPPARRVLPPLTGVLSFPAADASSESSVAAAMNLTAANNDRGSSGKVVRNTLIAISVLLVLVVAGTFAFRFFLTAAGAKFAGKH